MHELIVNLHMHTTYSDGSGSHADIGQAALRAGVDVVIVTDHNILVSAKERYYEEKSPETSDPLFRPARRRVLMLVGEEVHDQARIPQKNHLLVFGARREMAGFASDPQMLIDNVRKAGGICFLAHPHEADCPPIKEDAIDWVDWSIQGYHGLELWNGLSEFKTVAKTYLHVLFYAFFPHLVNRFPENGTLQKWDELTRAGKRIVGLGGSDAHALVAHAGPFRRVIYPYVFHFQTINTHLLTDTPLSGDLDADRAQVYQALQAGHAFVAFDLGQPAHGFRFSAQGRDGNAIMGDEIRAQGGITLKCKLPNPAECTLLKDGRIVQTWGGRDGFTYTTNEPGVYRVEVYRRYLGMRRGWIYSNPIYVL